MKHDESNRRFGSQIQPFVIDNNRAQWQFGSQMIRGRHSQSRIQSAIQNALRFRTSEEQKSSHLDQKNKINTKITDISSTEKENSKERERNA